MSSTRIIFSLRNVEYVQIRVNPRLDWTSLKISENMQSSPRITATISQEDRRTRYSIRLPWFDLPCKIIAILTEFDQTVEFGPAYMVAACAFCNTLPFLSFLSFCRPQKMRTHGTHLWKTWQCVIQFNKCVWETAKMEYGRSYK